MAIAARIAEEVRRLGTASTDHFPFVGVAQSASQWNSVGPQRDMPSGGLVAMGNIRAFVRDLRAGFLPLWFGQRRFVRKSHARYDAVVAVGDAYCLSMALRAKLPTIFVGTAKSLYVAPYGRLERRILRRAARVFVRDRATAEDLRAHGIAAQSAGNVIADLARSEDHFPWTGAIRIAVLPGSRSSAYANAQRIGRVLAALQLPDVAIAVSVAPAIDARRLLDALAVPARAWDGSLGAIFEGATLAVGQAGTANEAAAGFGVPVVALVDPKQKREDWYRMRQRRLLDGALAMISAEPVRGAEELRALIEDRARLAEMGRIGRERIGPPGGALAIATATLAAAQS